MREERCAKSGAVCPKRMNEIFIPACRGDEAGVYSQLCSIMLFSSALSFFSYLFTTPHVFSLMRCLVFSEFSHLTTTSL